jgi:hypothetical protein
MIAAVAGELALAADETIPADAAKSGMLPLKAKRRSFVKIADNQTAAARSGSSKGKSTRT